MIMVCLKGGLGNQMFEYAAGKALAVKHHTDLVLDLTVLLDRTPRENFVYRDYDLVIFKLQAQIATPAQVVAWTGKYPDAPRRWWFKARHKIGVAPRFVGEIPYRLTPQFADAPRDCYLDGYWQSEKYFKPIAHIIRDEFTLREPLSVAGQELAERIVSTNSVCLNVRRGDYVTSPIANQHHGVCGMGYFLRGISIIAEPVVNPHFFVFSDDIEWCQNEMHLDYPCEIITHDYAGEKFSQYLQLMTLCKHFIIPNSSFGWWAAWLATNPNKIVIAPRKWIRATESSIEICPDEWILV